MNVKSELPSAFCFAQMVLKNQWQFGVKFLLELNQRVTRVLLRAEDHLYVVVVAVADHLLDRDLTLGTRLLVPLVG